LRHLTVLLVVSILAFSGVVKAAAPAQAAVTDNPAAAEARVLDAETPTAVVTLNGVRLFRVTGVSGLPAADRARMIEERLVAFARETGRPLDELSLVPTPHYTMIMAGTDRLAAVHDIDAAVEHVDRETLAQINLARLRDAVAAYRTERTPAYLLRQTGYALVATLLLVALVLGVRVSKRGLSRRLEARLGRLLEDLEGRSKSLVRAQWIGSMLRWLVNAIATLLIVTAALAWLGFVLELFPWTRPTGVQLVSLFAEPLLEFGRGTVRALPGLAFLVVLYFVTRALLRFLKSAFEAVQAGTVRFDGFDAEWADPTYKIARLFVVIFALVIAYPYVPGSGSEAFKGLSLLLGVMFSIGSSSIISNLLAGYTMTYRRAFRRGDMVQVGDVIGRVINMRLQVTHLQNMRNEEIIVPNSEILSSTVINFTSLGRTEGLMIVTTVGIGYETPWRQVESLLLIAAGRTAGTRREPAPFVLIPTLGDFCASYQLHVAIEEPTSRLTTLAALNRNVLDVFNEYGVQIMTPAYEGDPETPKVVPQERWYAAPAVPPAAGPTR
jgi:small-conductance mechanosensitive channel